MVTFWVISATVRCRVSLGSQRRSVSSTIWLAMTESEIRALLAGLERLPVQRWMRPGCVAIRRADVPEDDRASVDEWVNTRRGRIVPSSSWKRARGLAMRGRALAGSEVRPDPGIYELPEAELQR